MRMTLDFYEWLIASVVVITLARYLVVESVFSWLRTPIEDALVKWIESTTEGSLQARASGWLYDLITCPLCVGQWVSFGVYAWHQGVWWWNWSLADLYSAVSLNFLGVVASIAMTIANTEDEDEE